MAHQPIHDRGRGRGGRGGGVGRGREAPQDQNNNTLGDAEWVEPIISEQADGQVTQNQDTDRSEDETEGVEDGWVLREAAPLESI